MWRQFIMATTNKMPWHASPLNMLLQQTRQKSKMKTNKSAQKRFRVRGNGTLIRNFAGAQHNTGHRTRKRNNRLRQSGPVKGKKLNKKMSFLIGNY
mmetsp:Transcript_30446/g.46100  ORF Transcript_30446/g.46100 Transcript_30446/m.46100 type:complete len:96 (+) Transcript_30446:96-383(+)